MQTEQRQQPEEWRDMAEHKRQEAETQRQKAETARDIAEAQRQITEETRLTTDDLRKELAENPPTPTPEQWRTLATRINHLEARMGEMEAQVLRGMEAILTLTQDLRSLLAKQQQALMKETAEKAQEMSANAKRMTQRVHQQRNG